MNRKLKTTLILTLEVLICVLLSSLTGDTMSIPEPWVFSTVYISNFSTNKAGTGFLVYRRISEDSGKVFLVSNKHVLIPKALQGNAGENKEAKAKILLNRTEGETLRISEIEIILRDKDGTEYWRGHPDERVDVAGIDFTFYISEKRVIKPELKVSFITEDRLITKEKLEADFVSVGDHVIILGYPLNLVEGGHCIPVARDGTVATHPKYNFRGLPIILIDSTMVRGSSGSPVFLPTLPYIWTSSTNMQIGKVRQAGVIGIVSRLVPDWEMEIRKTITFGLEPETVSVVDIANLGIIFRAETIIETIDQLGYPVWEPKENK